MPSINTGKGTPLPSVSHHARPGTTSRWFDDQGNICASNQRDLISTLGSLMAASSSRQVRWSDPNHTEVSAETAKQRRDDAVAAFHDHSTSVWAETGSQIAAVIYETAKRSGFLRRFLMPGELQQGTIPRIQMRFQNVQALIASDVVTVLPYLVKQRYIYPPEFYILANIRVEDRDVAQGASDIMEDAYDKAIEQMNVQEDRVLVNMFNQTVGITNPLFLLAGGATPSNIAAMRTAILQYGLQAEQWLISADYWTDIAGNAQAFGNLFDPVTRYELVQTGFLGTLLGMNITTDGFRDPMQQVVAPNDSYVLTAPVNLGAYTDRGAPTAVEQNQYADGIPGRGWFFRSLISETVANSRGVVRGRRV